MKEDIDKIKVNEGGNHKSQRNLIQFQDHSKNYSNVDKIRQPTPQPRVESFNYSHAKISQVRSHHF